VLSAVDWSSDTSKLPRNGNVESEFGVIPNGLLSICVEDSGVGISKQDLGLVFDEGRLVLALHWDHYCS